MKKLIDIYNNSIFPIYSDENEKLIGTCFFFASNKVLTASHCLTQENLYIRISSEIKIPIIEDNKINDPVLDYAIIKTDPYYVHNTAVLLGNYFSSLNEETYIYGYSDENPFGHSITGRIEGLSRNEVNHLTLSIKDGNIIGGISGAPLLNLGSGKVIGLVVETKNKFTSAGGYALLINSIVQKEKTLIKENQQFHTKNNEWIKNNLALREGIGLLDDTIKNHSKHFNIFPNEEIKVDELFLDPSYLILQYEDVNKTNETKNNEFLLDSLKILEYDKILLITGAYGAGKTIVTKYLQNYLIKGGNDTIFIHGSDLQCYDPNSLISDIKKRKIEEKLYVFVDAFDEINSIIKPINEVETLLTKVFQAATLEGVYIIINFRTPNNESSDNIFSNIPYYIAYPTEKYNLKIIKLNYFAKTDINNWLNNYSFLMERKKKGSFLTIDDIYKAHKNLITACQNPLLLFILSKYHFNEYLNVSRVKDIYDLYESFVDSTVRGKFSDEKKMGNYSIKRIIDKYRKFLTEVAKEIAINSQKFRYDTDKSSEILLDDNNITYGIEKSRIKIFTLDIIKRILGEEYNELNHSNLHDTLLNCYFFESVRNSWRFRDNNVLFFFLAEIFKNSLLDALVSYKDLNDLNKVYSSLSKLSDIPLHPIILDFLFNKISTFPIEQKNELINLIRQLIHNHYVLNLNESVSVFNIDYKKLNIDVFLSILFLQYNNEGFTDIAYYFKRFNWFLSAAKRINPEIVFLAKRFFKKVNIQNTELRRINLKGFNFDRAILDEVKFIQVKLYNVRKNFTKFRDVEYLLCDINDSEMRNINGNITFNNSIIKNLKIWDYENGTNILFKRCYINNLEIHSKEQKNEIKLCFDHCDIDTLIFRDSISHNFEIKDSSFHKIKIDGSKVKYTITENKSNKEIYKQILKPFNLENFNKLISENKIYILKDESSLFSKNNQTIILKSDK
jgi:hypothetical protein